MTTEDKEILFATPLARIEKLRCRRAARGISCSECKSEHQIAVPLSGVNVHHVRGKTFTITPSCITLSNRGEEYRVSHPHGSGETQLTIILQEALLLQLLEASDPSVEEHRATPFFGHQLPIDFKTRFGLQLLMAAARSNAATALELEETTIALVKCMLGPRDIHVSAPALTSRDRELTEAAKLILATRFAETISLQSLAETLRISEHHLCRVYRRATGTTLWSELQQLRARTALLRLADGERDLTALGLSLGYSHHSHFTSAFRRELGVTPSRARSLFESGSLHEVRQLLS